MVWLDVAPDVAWARTHGSARPLARERTEFERLYREREPIYASLADVIVPAERSAGMAEILPCAECAPSGFEAPVGRERVGRLSGVHRPRACWQPTSGRSGPSGRRFLVTDGHVARLYADALEPLAARVSIMPGEQSKTIAHAEIVWTELARAGMTRTDVLIALGGGVVGDLAGFCAATYQRGVRYVQVPTTLVAQVDSAYGGKTGVDLAEAKNYVGAYHQPTAVIADTGTLTTLPAEELAAGYAEVVKTALIAGGELWERVRSGADPADMAVIAACARTKLRIVAARRARRRPAAGAEPRAHGRARDRDRHRLRPLPPRGGRRARAARRAEAVRAARSCGTRYASCLPRAGSRPRLTASRPRGGRGCDSKGQEAPRRGARAFRPARRRRAEPRPGCEIDSRAARSPPCESWRQ